MAQSQQPPPPPPPPKILTSPSRPTTTTSTSNSTTTTIPPHPPEKKWYHHLTLDLLLHSLNLTLFHPFIAWILVLCLRAQATPYTHLSMRIAIGYATLLTALSLAHLISQQIAYGAPRVVEFSEEVVVITGGASGLGLILARIYGMRGVSVAVLDVKGEKEVEGAGEEESGVSYYQCDIGDRRALKGVVGRVVEDLGPPTVLINCAAAPINGQPLLSLSAEAFQKTIQTNLLAAFHTCQILLPHILAAENGGTIVNVSSVLGQLCAAGLADYSASKAGLSALHRTLEAELRVLGHEDKVKTVLVETGQVSTPLFKTVKTPNSFLAPVLEPIQVAREIVAAVDNGRSGVIRLPTYAQLMNWYAVLPAGLQRIARFLAGIDNAATQAFKTG